MILISCSRTLMKSLSRAKKWQMEINMSKQRPWYLPRPVYSRLAFTLLIAWPLKSVHSEISSRSHFFRLDVAPQHIEYIGSKASKTLGFVRRHLYSANQATKPLAYVTSVRLQLEYAAIIWNTHQEYLNNKLESLQNKAARSVAKKYSRYHSVTDFKSSLNLCMLEKRLLTLLSHFHRLYHNPLAFREAHLELALRVSPQLDRPFKVQPKFTHAKLCISHHYALPPSIGTNCQLRSLLRTIMIWLINWSPGCILIHK